MNSETAKRLLDYRKANGYSQEELAEKLGVSRQAISNWERNESNPDTDNLIALAKLYNISIDELLLGRDEPEKAQSENQSAGKKGVYQENTASDNASDYTSFRNGVHVHNSNNHVDINWDGIHIDTADGEHVHMNKEEMHEHIYNKTHPKSSKLKIIINALLPVLAVISYVFIGTAYGGRGWAYGWLVFLLIPIISSTITAVQMKKPSAFCYPVFATLLFLFLGFFFNLWHPAWVVFITIPAFYAICSAFKKTDDKDNIPYNEQQTYYTPQGSNVVDETRREKHTGPALVILLTIIVAATCISIVAVAGIFAYSRIANYDLPNGLGSQLVYKDGDTYIVGNSEVAPVSNIEIEWIAGKINISHYDGDTISFSETNAPNDDYTLRYLVKDNTLSLKYCKSGIKPPAEKLSKELTILVPEGISFDELQISTVSAPVFIDNVNATELDVDYVSGNVNVSGSYSEISTDGVSGNIEIHNISPVFVCDTDTVSGDCTLYLDESVSGFYCDSEVVSGSISTRDFDNFTAKGSFADTTHTYGDGSIKISFNAVSGSLVVAKETN